jgi:hypothetical protein
MVPRPNAPGLFHFGAAEIASPVSPLKQLGAPLFLRIGRVQNLEPLRLRPVAIVHPFRHDALQPTPFQFHSYQAPATLTMLVDKVLFHATRIFA